MHLETITKRRLYMFTESATMQPKGNELMNTRMTFAWAVAGVVMLGLVGCDGPGLTKYYARRDVEAHFVAMEERGDVAMTTDGDG